MEVITIKIPKVHNFRKIYDSEKGFMYEVTCPIMSIYIASSEIDKVLGINPRNQKQSSSPSKSMQETLRDEQDSFVFRNRGLTFIVQSVSWDNKTEILEMLCEIDKSPDFQINGLADGAHTYEVIKKFISETEEPEQEEITAEVKLDIITGFIDRDEIIAMVDSRNKSTPVRTESLLDYKGFFKPIKEILKGQIYDNNIAYFENQLVDEKKPESGYRQINISSVLSYLMCLDLNEFNENKHPISAYSSKKKVLDWFEQRYKKDEKDTIALIEILPEILELRDYIESQMYKIWNKISGRFGDQPGVKKFKKAKKLDFSEHQSEYLIPGGYIYPVFSAFRALLIKKNDKYEFNIDNPKKIFDQMNLKDSKSLIYKLVNVNDKNPNAIGKNSELYDSCYGSLRGYYYESLNK